MKRHLLQLGFVATLATLSLTPQWRSLAQATRTTLTAASLQVEVSALRDQGSQGLQTFLQRHREDLSPGKAPDASLGAALDQLCQMKDCYASRLYWYTDLAAAQAAAKASGKPILSLRLLGRLDKDLSCANSRLFRVALYPNTAVAKLLRDKFILHWQSERPAPKVTIDFGDGRTLERTLTGNSIHYVLAADGRPLDALPGLYSPQAFITQLQQILALHQQFQQLPLPEQTSLLRTYHRNRLNQLQSKWAKQLKQAGIAVPPRLLARAVNPNAPIDAVTAGQLAMTKAVIENPVMRDLQLAGITQRELTNITDKEAWQRLASLPEAKVTLDPNSLALIQHKKGNLQSAALPALIQNLEAAIAVDTVRNEYLLHGQLHRWFSQGTSTDNLETLNQNVYSRLFLTPANDPWLGLVTPDSFSALDQDGIGNPASNP
jgi:hypothetical protein